MCLSRYKYKVSLSGVRTSNGLKKRKMKRKGAQVEGVLSISKRYYHLVGITLTITITRIYILFGVFFLLDMLRFK